MGPIEIVAMLAEVVALGIGILVLMRRIAVDWLAGAVILLAGALLVLTFF